MDLKIIDKGKADKSELDIPESKEYNSWFSLESDYTFFTPGLLWWKTGVERDVVADFVLNCGVSPSDCPMKYRSTFPLFSVQDPIITLYRGNGVFKEDISKTLYMCPKTIWTKFSEYIESAGFYDTREQSMGRAMLQPDVLLPDFGEAALGVVGSNMIHVVTYGMMATKYCTLWRQDWTNKKLPEAVRAAPIDVVIKDGLMFLKGI